MLHVLYVEISAVGICLLLIILFKQHGEIGTSILKRQFNYLIYATIAMLMTDTACWLLDGAVFSGAYILKTAAESIYYFFNILIPFLWVMYIEIAVSKEREKAFRRLKLLSIPMFALFVLIVVNLFTGSVFTIDASNVYARNDGFYAFAVIAYAYLIYASVVALRAGRRASWKEDQRRYYGLVVFVVLPGVAGIIQTFFYGVALIWVFTAISIMMMYIDSMNRQISTDPLTGINNRRELTRYIQRETRDPSHQGLLALIMMDVDDFKRVNDVHGHYHGDMVLGRVSEILKSSCKNTPAFLARYGGDEFCIVYPAENLREVDNLIAKILRNALRWNTVMDDPVKIGLSIGYTTWRFDQSDTVDDFYRRADEKMYQVKNAKKKAANTGGVRLAR